MNENPRELKGRLGTAEVISGFMVEKVSDYE